jgi:hypothetical protein
MAAATMDQFVYKPESAHEDWPIWVFRFENFLALNAVDLTKNDGKASAAKHLIHAGGSAIIKVLKTFDNMSEASYEQLKAAMEAYCMPKDTKAALYRFTGTRQCSDEKLSDYVMRLKPLAYAGGISKVNSDAEVLRVIGQHASSVDVKLKCLEKDMDCSKLVAWFSTIESHQQCLRVRERTLEDINYVESSKRKHPVEKDKKCNFCGGKYPHEGQCPARGAVCNFCHNKNHYESECRRKKASQAAPSSSNQSRWRNDNGNQSTNHPNRNRFSSSNGAQRGNTRGNRVFNVEDKPQEQGAEANNAKLLNMFNKWLSSIQDTPDEDGTQQE